ncbi:MAG: hypothetical protein ACI31B_05685 [Muribaculaceae bacterium]
MNKAYGKIVSNFSIDGSVKSIEPLGNGLINDTFKVTITNSSTPDYGYFLRTAANCVAEDSKDIDDAYSEGEALAVYRELRRQGDFAAFCREFMHNADYQVARNALWCLTKASHEEIRQCQPLLHQLIDLAMTTANSSVRRLSLNVVERLDMPEDDVRSDFLDFCFAHFADVAEYPGIQSLCLKLAHRMCHFYPELMGELKRTLEAMEISEYSPALRSVRSRILSGKLK